MRIPRMALWVILMLGCMSAVDLNKSSGSNGISKQPEELAPGQGGQGPPTGFAPYTTPWTGRFEMREEQAIVVGELVADCTGGDPAQAVFRLLAPTPDFVRIVPQSPCTCPGVAIAKLVVFPRRGDAGKYHVNIEVGSCDGLGGNYSFTLKVRGEL